MEKYITLISGMILLPVLYCGALWFCRPSFRREENQKRLPLRTAPEYAALFFAEAAFVSIWRAEQNGSISILVLALLFAMLAAMTVFCMTDYWEQIVPNRLLLVLLVIFVLIAGFCCIYDTDMLRRELSGIFLGIIFCGLCFGLGYLLSHGNMGAGDVKLALVMGLYLTGEYVAGAMLYGCIAAAVFSIVQLFRKKLTRKDKIPFVPFLYIGLIIRYLAG